MNSELKIAVVLSAFDKMSKVIDVAVSKAQAKLSKLSNTANTLAERSFNTGKQMTAAGLAVGLPLQQVISQFANLEDAQLSLMSSMMDANGKVLPVFDKLNQKAIQLGNLLPGNTKDFYEMFDTMIKNGAVGEDIINGLGKSAAYLAVQMKLPYTVAGEMVTRLQVATGVANKDMMQFMDTLSKVNRLGVQPEEMQYAFQRSAGQLKALGIQGIQETEKMSSVYAYLIKIMGSGERVGTGMAALFASFEDTKAMSKMTEAAQRFGISLQFINGKTGEFLGVSNMLKQFDKLKVLNTAQRSLLLTALAGPKGSDNQIASALITGLKPIQENNTKMAKMASLMKIINNQLGSVNNKWDALVGTMQNAAAEIGSKLAPALKKIFDKLNNQILPAVISFVDKHSTLVKYLGYGAAAFSGLALTMGYLSFAFSGVLKFFSIGIKVAKGVITAFGFISKAFQLLTLIIEANPIILIITGIAISALLIYKYWDKISAFFEYLWTKIKQIFHATWEWIKKMFLNYTPEGLIIKHWDKISAFFAKVWQIIKLTAQIAWDAIKKILVAPIAWIKKKWQDLVDWFENAWKKIKGWASSAFDWAIKSPTTHLLDKMKADVPALHRQMQMVAQIVDDYLPHSPAKKGALSRLNKVRIIETIADTMNPHILANKMRLATNGITGTGIKGRSINSQANQMQFTLHVHLSGSATQADARMISKEAKKQFASLLRQHEQQKERISF